MEKNKEVNENVQKNKKIKILEVTAFSSGICGVWTRVQKESELLAKKGYEVRVFSSNIHRGSGKIEFAPDHEEREGIKIRRFKSFGSFGKNSFFWNYKKEALEFNPKLIICHAYRQYYSTAALKIAKRLKVSCILVTHAPFLDKKLRSWKENLMVFIYDNLFGRRLINKYSKILTITKWEEPYLKNLGVKEDKIIYIPNGIPEEFFKIKIINRKKRDKYGKILFLGRIAPIKDIETLVKAFKIALEKNKNIFLELVGPVEEDYGNKIKELVKELNLGEKIIFHEPVYDLKEKIFLIDSSDIFVLPSKREAMPQALIEVMSREKLVISSKTLGGIEIIEEGKNGYLFEIGNEKELSDKILLGLENNKKNNRIKKEARKSVEKFNWNKLINDINLVIKNEIQI